MINGKKEVFYVLFVDYHAESISLTPIFHVSEKNWFFYYFYFVNIHYK